MFPAPNSPARRPGRRTPRSDVRGRPLLAGTPSRARLRRSRTHASSIDTPQGTLGVAGHQIEHGAVASPRSSRVSPRSQRYSPGTVTLIVDVFLPVVRQVELVARSASALKSNSGRPVLVAPAAVAISPAIAFGCVPSAFITACSADPFASAFCRRHHSEPPSRCSARSVDVLARPAQKIKSMPEVSANLGRRELPAGRIGGLCHRYHSGPRPQGNRLRGSERR